MAKTFKRPSAFMQQIPPQTQQQQDIAFQEDASPYQEQAQVQVPFTPLPFGQFGNEDEQYGQYRQQDISTFMTTPQLKIPATPFPDIPVTPTTSIDEALTMPVPATSITNQATALVPVVPTTPATTIPTTPLIETPGVEPRIRKDVERYVQWLHRNNNLPISQQKLQAYQTESLEMKKVGKREVRTFAPFQEHTSALKVITSDQFTIIAAILLYWCVGLFFLHIAMVAFTLGVITLLYISGFVISSILATRSLSGKSGEEIDENIIHTLDQLGVEWPSYTILCPLYKETVIVPQFVRAIKALDYPEEKLQVLFLTEENDNETRAALYNLQLPSGFTVLTVPKGSPQTKPRACNFGLLQAKGQFIVIFDAEDKPEQYQLKKAVLTFANHGPEVACVQAKLNYYNSKQNLLTRWFTAEYSTWFDIMLPGLQRIGFSLPLGGTSNHFRTEVLRALGGWDAFNVTEDCDLGLRISQYNLKTAVLDSTTYEEATSRPKVWLYQRSRWIKGYFQTYLVHMRNPLKMLQKGHFRKFFSLQIIVGAWTSVLLLNPLMWALTLIYILFRPVHLYSMLFPGPVLYAGAFCLIFGNFFYVYIHVIGCLRRQEYALIGWVLLIPLYWVMMSMSAYIAFYQLIVKPHYWEKTQHGNHLAPVAKTQVLNGSAQLAFEERAIPSSMPTMRVAAIAVGNMLRQVVAPAKLDSTTQRVTALRGTLTTQLGKRKARSKHQPHVRDLWLVATTIVASITSITACWYFFQQHEILLYGDALSHLRLARSVFDSATPGLTQLGGVWLPLQHILFIPFVWNDYLWHTGLAGSFLSMPCYVISAAYLFLTIRCLTKNSSVSFVGTLVFILNPNILYLQSTPLSELLCIVTLTITCYYFLRWTQTDNTSYLIFAACSTFLSTISRYDGWALFVGLFVLVGVISWMKHLSWVRIQSNIIIFGAIGGLGIVLWLIWCKIIFGDPLYFQHSQFSAQAQQIEFLQRKTLYTYHNLWLSFRYYTIDSIDMIGPMIFILAFLSIVVLIIQRRFKPEMLATLVFLMPFAFYILSLYTGQAILWIPGAVPASAPNQFFNVRYGAQIIAPSALFLALLINTIRIRLKGKIVVLCYGVLLAAIVTQTIFTTSGGIVSIRDGQVGLSCASAQLADFYFAQHYNGGRILVDTFSSNFNETEDGIDLKNIIYDGSGHLWRQALQNPSSVVDWVVAYHGDLVTEHLDVTSSAFLQQFTPVVQDASGRVLFHKKGLPTLPTRILPSNFLSEHRECDAAK